jgi:hypothetical protein
MLFNQAKPVCKELTIKIIAKTTAGVRASTFTNTVRFLEEVLLLEIVQQDENKEVARLKLPSGEILEVYGPKNIWHPFTTAPDWEVIIADIRNTREKDEANVKPNLADDAEM